MQELSGTAGAKGFAVCSLYRNLRTGHCINLCGRNAMQACSGAEGSAVNTFDLGGIWLDGVLACKRLPSVMGQNTVQ